MTARLFALGLLALALGCGGAAGRSAPLRVDRQLSGGATTLVLVAAPGVRINARVKPSLELPDGTVLRFDSPHLTADSAYFTRPPTTVLSGSERSVAGTLRASVCSEHELVCRTVTLEL
ncbi:MAG: hypothetical protein ACJ8DJ_18865 [Gemmatimonadales bacterium]|nr:hypothetical protein [Gemmatimonadota bacterium]